MHHMFKFNSSSSLIRKIEKIQNRIYHCSQLAIDETLAIYETWNMIGLILHDVVSGKGSLMSLV